MRILIVENELYLAQSISTKLSEIGYICEIASNIKDALKTDGYDAVLLSANISGQNFYPVIEKHKNSIIIMMITYISNDTISNPIKAGASDYIQKPFMIEELIRKLEHLKKHNGLIHKNRVLESYIEYTFGDIKNKPYITKKITTPILLKSTKQIAIDAAVFDYTKKFNDFFEFISLDEENAFEKISKMPFSKLLYLVNFQNMKSSNKEKFFAILEAKRAIISSVNMNEHSTLTTIVVDANDNSMNNNIIFTKDDYIKNVIVNFQHKLTDVELGKKLGISRKCVWEKRKKYGLFKKQTNSD